MNEIWAGHGLIIRTPRVQIQFRYVTSFQNEGDRKAIAVKNWDQISDFSPFVKLWWNLTGFLWWLVGLQVDSSVFTFFALVGTFSLLPVICSERELVRYMSSHVRLSVVCNVGAPYSGDWNFRQCFYAMWYLGHPSEACTGVGLGGLAPPKATS